MSRSRQKRGMPYAPPSGCNRSSQPPEALLNAAPKLRNSLVKSGNKAWHLRLNGSMKDLCLWAGQAAGKRSLSRGKADCTG